MDREQDDIVNRLRGLLREARETLSSPHIYGPREAAPGSLLHRIDAALNVPNAATREAMEEARALPEGDKRKKQPTSDQPSVLFDDRRDDPYLYPRKSDEPADQPDGSLRELCDLAYDHLLSAGYPEDGPVLTRIATGCTPDQQKATR
jgi:hypothetical protein